MAVKEQQKLRSLELEAEKKLRERWQKEQEEENRRRQEAEEKREKKLIDRAMKIRPAIIKIVPKNVVISKIRPHVKKVTKIEELLQRDYPYNSSSKKDVKRKVLGTKAIIAIGSMVLIGTLYGFNRLADDVVEIPVGLAILISVIVDFLVVLGSFYLLEERYLSNPEQNNRKKYFVVSVSFLVISVLFFVGYALA